MHGHFDGAMLTALGVVHREVKSARPDAPILDEPGRERRLARTTRLRSALARALNHAAQAIEPPPYRRPSCEGEAARS
jgi:hypothetical protein